MSSMMPNPMLSPGGNAPGATIAAPPTDDPNFQVPDVQAFGTSSQNMLGPLNNAIQGAPPLGGNTDATYLAGEAALRSQISQQYQSLLQQLGYTDPSTGATIQGRTVQDANIKLAQLQHDMQQAAMATTRNAQQTGTIFSGIRGQQLADAERPSIEAQGQLGLDTSRSLADAYTQAHGLISTYNTQNNQLLAAAASRAAAGLTAQPPATGGGALPFSGGAPPAPASALGVPTLTPPPGGAVGGAAGSHAGSYVPPAPVTSAVGGMAGSHAGAMTYDPNAIASAAGHAIAAHTAATAAYSAGGLGHL